MLKQYKNHKIVKPEIFEKDNDINSHMDFVSSTANLRTLNTEFQSKQNLKLKELQGKSFQHLQPQFQ
jgi:hypothetical protein